MVAAAAPTLPCSHHARATAQAPPLALISHQLPCSQMPVTQLIIAHTPRSRPAIKRLLVAQGLVLRLPGTGVAPPADGPPPVESAEEEARGACLWFASMNDALHYCEPGLGRRGGGCRCVARTSAQVLGWVLSQPKGDQAVAPACGSPP